MKCPKCGYKMIFFKKMMFTGNSLTPVDGWHCPRCQYDEVKQ